MPVPGKRVNVDFENNIGIGEGDHDIRVGTRIIKQLSTTFYPNPLIIFDELVSNASDALASVVRIRLEDDTISIEDDGEGMTPDGLVHFFYISHTEKDNRKIRSFKGVKRYIIGKFGIGKISLYQVCKKFNISTWKNGIVSSASFNFEEFDKSEFVDKFKLHVISEKTDKSGSGTTITLLDLNKDALKGIDVLAVKRRLVKTMPLIDGFRIVLSGTGVQGEIEVKPEDIVGRIRNTYPIDEDVPEVGPVTGKIVFFNKEEPKSYGVNIRIYGRLVNVDSVTGVINFATFTHPRMLYNKIHVSLNADGLNDALQTNRAGFILTHPAYMAFVEWLKRRIVSLLKKEYIVWEGVKEELISKTIPVGVTQAFQTSSHLDPIRPAKSQRTPSRRDITISSQSVIRRDEQKSNLATLIRSGKIEIEVKPLSVLEPEVVFDSRKKVLLINSLNPSYAFAHSQARLPGLVYHIFKATAVLIAIESASTVEEFKTKYDEITRDVDLLDNLTMILRKKS